MQKKEPRQTIRKRLVLPRETVRTLSDAELPNVAGGTCYSDKRNSQCCDAA